MDTANINNARRDNEMSSSLAKLDAVRLALERATTVPELQRVIQLAETAKAYYRKVKDKVLELDEYIVRAERKLGEMLKAAKAAGQITHGRNQKAVVDGDDHRVRLSDAGISKDLSSRTQKLADIPEQEFEQKITEQKETGKLSANKMLGKNGKRAARARKASPKKPAQGEITVNSDAEVKEFREKMAHWEKVFPSSDFERLLKAIELIIDDQLSLLEGNKTD